MEPETPLPARPGRVRRFFAYPLVQAFIGGAMVLSAASAVSAIGDLLGIGGGPRFPLLAVVFALAIVLVWKAYKRWIERERDREFALAGALAELAAGLAAGFALFTVMTGCVWLLGGIQFHALRPPGETQWAYWLAIAIISGFMEETLMRGLLFRAVEKVSGSWAALAVSAAFFGGAHIFNPNASWLAAVAIAFEAGILLGAAYMLTRRLWLAVGMHAAWNFTQGWVFSVPVSGTGGQPIGLISTTRIGPDWLTGGSFGLEASVMAMIVATVAGLLLLWWAHRLGRFVPAPWRRERTPRS
jgi:membrane protease YdiL (CAAX protease family)